MSIVHFVIHNIVAKVFRLSYGYSYLYSYTFNLGEIKAKQMTMIKKSSKKNNKTTRIEYDAMNSPAISRSFLLQIKKDS